MDAELDASLNEGAETLASIDGVSANGGAFALFAPSTRETFYRSPDTISASLRLTGLLGTGQAGRVYFDRVAQTIVIVLS